MNPDLEKLHSYPFEKLAELKKGASPPGDKPHIALSIGEPQHQTPHFITETVISHLHGLANYPTTRGIPALREAVAAWLSRRFQIPADLIDPERHILPVSGTREALFSFAQCVIDSADSPLVAMPNPFYQIYEGAALLAGADPYYLATTEETGFLPDFDGVPAAIWERCQLLYVCSPGNPTGAVLDAVTQQKLIELAERYDFIIASDECYTEIYADESAPPPGLLQSAYAMGNETFKRCVVFQSLSKRSNAPGLRSGFVAGDADIIKKYYLYRTYHGSAMPLPTQHASIQAWSEEAHVTENRRRYRDKFAAVMDILADACTIHLPPAGFYLWPRTPIPDTEFARELFARENVTVLPGSFLSREQEGCNPGRNHVRMALVPPLEDCIDAAHRIKHFYQTLQPLATHSEKP